MYHQTHHTTVVHQQPAHQHVIVQQQPTMVVHQRQHVVVNPYIPPSQFAMSFGPSFNSGMCDCLDDGASCADVFFCGYCQLGHQKHFSSYGRPGMDSTACCCAFFLDMCCTFGCTFAFCAYSVRSRVAQRYAIIESGIETFGVGCCCPQCSLCQTYREMDKRGEFPGGCCVTPSPVAIPPNQQNMGGDGNGGVQGSPVGAGAVQGQAAQPQQPQYPQAQPMSPNYNQQQSNGYPQQQQQQQYNNNNNSSYNNNNGYPQQQQPNGYGYAQQQQQGGYYPQQQQQQQPGGNTNSGF